jgi:hypothetical protein
LGQCNDTEFGCFDGTCVDLSKRCDEVDDCDDGSDEKQCDLIVIDPDRYRKEYPPISSSLVPTVIDVGNFSMF